MAAPRGSTSTRVGLIQCVALIAGVALVVTIVLMILWDVVHPPAVSTAMSFALRAGEASNLALFVLALGITVVLVVLQRVATWAIVRARGVVSSHVPWRHH